MARGDQDPPAEPPSPHHAEIEEDKVAAEFIFAAPATMGAFRRRPEA
jgi:hypothetical protein